MEDVAKISIAIFLAIEAIAILTERAAEQDSVFAGLQNFAHNAPVLFTLVTAGISIPIAMKIRKIFAKKTKEDSDSMETVIREMEEVVQSQEKIFQRLQEEITQFLELYGDFLTPNTKYELGKVIRTIEFIENPIGEPSKEIKYASLSSGGPQLISTVDEKDDHTKVLPGNRGERIIQLNKEWKEFIPKVLGMVQKAEAEVRKELDKTGIMRQRKISILTKKLKPDLIKKGIPEILTTLPTFDDDAITGTGDEKVAALAKNIKALEWWIANMEGIQESIRVNEEQEGLKERNKERITSVVQELKNARQEARETEERVNVFLKKHAPSFQGYQADISQKPDAPNISNPNTGTIKQLQAYKKRLENYLNELKKFVAQGGVRLAEDLRSNPDMT